MLNTNLALCNTVNMQSVVVLQRGQQLPVFVEDLNVWSAAIPKNTIYLLLASTRGFARVVPG